MPPYEPRGSLHTQPLLVPISCQSKLFSVSVQLKQVCGHQSQMPSLATASRGAGRGAGRGPGRTGLTRGSILRAWVISVIFSLHHAVSMVQLINDWASSVHAVMYDLDPASHCFSLGHMTLMFNGSPCPAVLIRWLRSALDTVHEISAAEV